MTVEEIMESEERDENNLFEIHFYLEGSFWRAYEWSAYLSRNFPSNLDDGERLRAIKKITKSCEEGFVQVGLQLKSFDKYFPNITNNDDLFEVNDRHITIHAKDFFPQITFESYVNTFSEWKRTIEPSNKEKKKYTHDVIITLDDDVAYPIDTISQLMEWHEKHPECIIAHEINPIVLNSKYVVNGDNVVSN